MNLTEVLLGKGMLAVTHKSDCDQGLSGLPLPHSVGPAETVLTAWQSAAEELLATKLPLQKQVNSMLVLESGLWILDHQKASPVD